MIETIIVIALIFIFRLLAKKGNNEKVLLLMKKKISLEYSTPPVLLARVDLYWVQKEKSKMK